MAESSKLRKTKTFFRRGSSPFPKKIHIISILSLIIPLLLTVAFVIFIEQKVLGYIQNQKGPHIISPYGLLQPFADAVKRCIKEPL